MPVITRIQPSKRNAKAAVIRVDGRSVGTLRLSTIADLGLREGTNCSAELLARMGHAAQLEAAVDLAMTWINRRALSEAQVNEKLKKQDVPDAMITQVLAHLKKIGAIDDIALATRAVEQLSRKGPAGSKLVREKLGKRGLLSQTSRGQHAEPEHNLIQEPSRDEIRSFLRQKLEGLKSLSPQQRHRRLASLLARRGIEEFTAMDLLNEFAPDVPEFEP